ncbi:MAG: DoxX family protein [Thermoanaerobaculia bacterium]
MIADNLARARALADRLSGPLRSALLLAFRLYWGVQFVQTGVGKLRNLERTTDFFASLGIPFPAANAAFVGTLESVGGVLLVLGLFSRIVALPLTVNMLVAYLTADRAALFALFSDPSAFVQAAPFPFLVTSLLVLAFGPGAASLDERIRRRTPTPRP